jgi:ferredoxin
MKITIDREECTSCEVCWGACPDVFQQNEDDSWSEIVAKHRVDGDPSRGEVGDDLAAGVREAAEGCPVEIIHVS